MSRRASSSTATPPTARTARRAPPRRGGREVRPALRPRHRRQHREASAAMSRRAPSATATASTATRRGQRRHVEAGVQLDGHGIDGAHREGSAAMSRRVQLHGRDIDGAHGEGSAAASRCVQLHGHGINGEYGRPAPPRRGASTWTATASTAITARAAPPVEAGVQLDGHATNGAHGEGSATASRRASRCVQLDGLDIDGNTAKPAPARCRRRDAPRRGARELRTVAASAGVIAAVVRLDVEPRRRPARRRRRRAPRRRARELPPVAASAGARSPPSCALTWSPRRGPA